MQICKLIFYGDYIKTGTDTYVIYCLGQIFPLLFMVILIQTHGSYFESILFTLSKSLIQLCTSVIFSTLIVLFVIIQIAFVFILEYIMPAKLQCLNTNQISILQQIISIQNIYNQLLRFPYLFMIGVSLSINYREQNIEKYILTYICAIIQTIINTFYVMISNPLLLINYRSLKKIRNNMFDQFINQLLTSTIPFLVGISILFENKIIAYNNSVIILTFIGLLNSIYLIYLIFIKLIYYNHIQVYGILLINSMMIIFCIGILLEIEYEILIVNFPLLVHILYQQFKRITLLILLKNPNKLEQDELSLAIFWQIRCPLNKQERIIYQCHQLLSHQRKCQILQCVCRQDLIRINKKIQKIQLDDQKDSWNLQFINQITRQQYMCNLPNICHYLSALLYFKQFTRLLTILCQNYAFDKIDQMKYSTFCYLIKKDLFKIKMNQIQQLNNEIDFKQVHKLISNDIYEKQVIINLETIIENKMNILKIIQLKDNKLFYQQYEQSMNIISLNQQQAEYLINQYNMNLPCRHLLFGHILNNWIKVLYEHKTIPLEQNTQYIQFHYDLDKIQIHSYSKGIPELLHYTEQEFKQIVDINQLLPQYIKSDHPNYVDDFFNTGRCRYYQEKNTIFVKQQNDVLLQMIASFELLLSYNCIRIIMLLQPNPQQDGIIIMNKEFQILGLTQLDNLQFVDLKKITLNRKIDRDYLVIPAYIDKNGKNHRQKYLQIIGNLEIKGKFIFYHIYQLEQGMKSIPTIIKQITQIDQYIDENEIIDIPYDIFNKQRNSMISNRINSIFLDDHQNSNPFSGKNTDKGFADQTSIQQTMPSLDFIHENKKFITYFNMTQEKFKEKSIQSLPYLLSLITLVKLIFIFLVLFIINIQNIIITHDNLNIQAYFLQFVQINHHIIEPIQKFYLARQTLQNYHILNEQDQLTIEEYYFYANFSNQNILEEYQNLKQQFHNILSDMRLQQFIFNQEIQIKQQIYHITPIQVTTYNTNINTAFSILLDSLHEQEIVYLQNKRVRSYISTTTYQMVNYLLFVKIFEDLSIQYYNEALYQGDQMLNVQLTILLTMTLINAFLMGITIRHIMKLKNKVENYLNLRIYIRPTDILEECRRLGEILKILKSKRIHNYPNIEFKQQKQMEQQLYRNHYVRFVLPIGLKEILIILIVILDVFIWQWVLSIEGFRQLSRFPIQIDILKQISDISEVIPAGFEYSEILYNWDKYTYFTNQDREQFINKTKQSINKMDNFKNLQLNEIIWLSQDFREIFNEMLSGDLCRLLQQQNRKRKYINFNYTCYNSNSGILQYGLLSSIAQLKDNLNITLLTNFTLREIPILQLEAVYLSSDVLYSLTDELDSLIQTISQDFYSNLIIISIIGYASAVIFLISVKQYLNKTIQNILWRAKLFIYIIPQITLHQSDDLEREMRVLLINTYN